MKKSILNLLLTICFNFAFAQMFSNGGATAQVCPPPTFNASGTFSQFTVSGATNVCAPATIGAVSVQSTWNLSGATTNISLRVSYAIQKLGTGGSWSTAAVVNGASFILPNNTSVPNQLNTTAANVITYSTGTYRVSPTLQWFCASNGAWYGVTTGPVSATVSVVRNLQNSTNSFNINGLANNGIITQCPSAWTDLIMGGITTGAITNYQIIIEKGATVTSFPATGTNIFTGPVNSATAMPGSINLSAISGYMFLLNHTGFVKVSLKVTASGACDNGVFTKSQVVQVNSIQTQADFFMYREGPFCNAPNDKKALQTTLPISTGTPTTPALLCSAIGWQGARKGGIVGIDVSGSNSWNMLVYECNAAGTRATNAPNIVNVAGVGDYTGTIKFNDNSLDFNASNPPYYTAPASNLDYFRNYYLWAMSSSATLTAYSAKIWCAELAVNVNGCIVSRKAYFRIANGVNGQNWRMSSQGASNLDFEEVEIVEPVFHPNPSNGIYKMEFDNLEENTVLQIFDNLGRNILTNINIQKTGRVIDLSKYPAGNYIYNLKTKNKIYHGLLNKY